MIVDDEMLILAGLAALIRATPGFEVVAEAASAEQAVAEAARVRPDVVLMDIRMPGTSGIVATERIIAAGAPDPPKVLILTTFDLDEYVYAALRAGAAGFLFKETSPERLLAAVATVATGDMLFASNVMRRLVDAYTVSRRGQLMASGADLAALTSRELEVLRLVATGLSNADIARWLGVSDATVKTHLNRTMAKLGLSSRAQAVVVAYESGLVTPHSPGTLSMER